MQIGFFSLSGNVGKIELSEPIFDVLNYLSWRWTGSATFSKLHSPKTVDAMCESVLKFAAFFNSLE